MSFEGDPIIQWPEPDDSDIGSAAYVNAQISQYGRKLFSVENDMSVDAATLDEQGLSVCRLKTDRHVEEYLGILDDGKTEASPSDRYPTAIISENDDLDNQGGGHEAEELQLRPSARFVLQKPSSGWGELLLTQHTMTAILGAFGAFPNLFRYLRAFGKKQFPRDEGLSGLDYKIHLDRGSGLVKALEIAYLLKYWEPEFGDNADTWSIRHALIYQRVNFRGLNSHTDHLLVRLSRLITARLLGVFKSKLSKIRWFVSDWTLLHEMFMSSTEDGLRDYVNYLDKSLEDFNDRSVMSSIRPGNLREFDTVDTITEDLKKLHGLIDCSLRTGVAIEANIEQMNELMRLLRSFAADSSPVKGLDVKQFIEKLRCLQMKHRSHLRVVKSLASRGCAIIDQYRDNMNLRNSEVARLDMETSKVHAAATLELATRSGREAHVLKVLTVLALMFAPATFIADFLQIGYIEVSAAGESLHFQASPGLQLYAALSIPLIAIIIAVYVIMERLKHQSLPYDTEKATDQRRCR